MGSEHSKSALQHNFPTAYHNLKDLFLYHYPCGSLIYTLKQQNGDIVFTVIAGARKGGVSYNKEELYYKQALLHKEYARAWNASEWLTRLPIHIKKATMIHIINKQIVEFEIQAWGISITYKEMKSALTVADAFKKTRENFDNIIKTNSNSSVFI